MLMMVPLFFCGGMTRPHLSCSESGDDHREHADRLADQQRCVSKNGAVLGAPGGAPAAGLGAGPADKGHCQHPAAAT